jgi:hypothetical protein
MNKEELEIELEKALSLIEMLEEEIEILIGLLKI